MGKIVKEYVSCYGMKSQHVTCKKSLVIATRIIKHIGSKSDGVSTAYKMDLVKS